MKMKKELTARQKTALANHKKKGTHTAKHMTIMKEEMLKGKTIEEAKLVKDRDIAKALDLPPIKLHCSVLAEDSIRKAIENWESKKDV